MTSPWANLDRPPLRGPALRAALVVDGGLWSDVRVVDETDSTNADVLAAVADDAPEGLVVVGEHQRSGRGRADRGWTAPARSGLTFSVLLRPSVPPDRWGWLPLLAGLSVVQPLRHMSGLDLVLKWPNDVLVDGRRKLAGVLAEVAGGAVVVGIGLNVSMREDERPVPGATSLRLEDSEVIDRDPVLRAVLRDLARRYTQWCSAGGDPDASGLGRDYREACHTVGRDVTVQMPGGRDVAGRVLDIDASGRLLVDDGTTVHALNVGDVHHIR